MSEYWKSTPKYWCKHCNAFVKDTPFERKQHESTAKHQGNLKRFLRGIQNDHERSEREKDKVKAEVERLNKVFGANSSITPSTAKQPTIRKPATGALSATDQKKQWAQLAEMGIHAPEGFRAGLALPGEWQKIAEHPVENSIKEETLSTGIKKRKYEGQEEEEEAGEVVARRGWGSTTRRYPGEVQPDLDALLNDSAIKKEKNFADIIKQEESPKNGKTATESALVAKSKLQSDENALYGEESESKPSVEADQDIHVKGEDEESNALSLPAATRESLNVPVFKKRKAKAK